jgi:hypothetical protein
MFLLQIFLPKGRLKNNFSVSVGSLLHPPTGPVPVVSGLTTTVRPARVPFPLRPCAGGFGFDN